MVCLLFFLGLGLLFLGGKYLVDGSVSFARELKISPLIIGIILVGFGTSVPELVVCIKSALIGSSDIVIGNVVGSNICNVLLVLSIGAIIYPITIKSKKEFMKDGYLLILSAVVMTIFALIGFVNIYSGVIFITILGLYIFFRCKNGEIEENLDEIPTVSKYVWISLLIALLGIVGVLIGADMLVESSIEIARELGVSEKLIALSAIAVGTSLPELVTSIIASCKKHSDLALGNIMGSNIFNILGILGVTSIIKKVDISPEILKFDIWVMNLAIVLMIIFCLSGKKLSRLEGCFLLAMYVGYTVLIALRG